MHMTKLDTTGEYQTIPPKTDAEIVALGTAYQTCEAARPLSEQICPLLLSRIGVALGEARSALEAAQAESVKVRTAGTALHAAMTEAAPLLDRTVVLLCRKYEANLSVLGDWGLETKTGARGQVRVQKPKTEPQRIDFLIKLTAKENGLPAADRLGEIPLARLTELAAVADQHRAGREQSASVREQKVAVRSAAAGTLYDLLQVAGGLHVVVEFEGRVTPALQNWGFNVQARKAPAAAGAPAATPAAGAPAAGGDGPGA